MAKIQLIHYHGVDYRPQDEGVTHINVFSDSSHVVGRWLSNFTRQPVVTPDGKFESLEGYYHYLKIWQSYCEEDKPIPFDVIDRMDELRQASGVVAQRLGRDLKQELKLAKRVYVIDRPGKAFRERFLQAMIAKLQGNQELLEKLDCAFQDGLVLLHYYIINRSVVFKPHYMWLVEVINDAYDSL